MFQTYRLAFELGHGLIGSMSALRGILCLFCFFHASIVIGRPGDLDTGFGGDGILSISAGQWDSGPCQLTTLAEGKSLVACSLRNGIMYREFVIMRRLADGSPDVAFGSQGRVVVPLGAGWHVLRSMVVQADQKILVAGNTGFGAESEFVMARLNPDGSLDTTFGVGGKVVTRVASGGRECGQIVLQPDGKIVMAGSAYEQDYLTRFVLIRYMADGSLDVEFGNAGKVVTSVGSTAAWANSVAVMPDGRIVVGGRKWDGTMYYNSVLACYAADGSLDASFGNGGLVVTSFGSRDDEFKSIKIGAGGLIVAAGYAVSAQSCGFLIARYAPDGSLDPGFGSPLIGRTITALTSNASGLTDGAHDVILQSDSKIVAVGVSQGGNQPKFTMLRYTEAGILDTTFDGDGKLFLSSGLGLDQVTLHDGKIYASGMADAPADGSMKRIEVVRVDDLGRSDTQFGADGVTTHAISRNSTEVNDVIISRSGKILTCGSTHNGTNLDVAVMRLLPDGTLDGTFGLGDGAVVTEAGSTTDAARTMAEQPDGKIVVAGYASNGVDADGLDLDFVVLRYHADGSLDTGFGSGGRVITPVGSHNDEAYAVVVQPDGKIVAAGYATTAEVSRHFALVRYLTDGSLDSSFGNGGKVITAVGWSDSISSLLLTADGSIITAGHAWNGPASDFAVARYLADGSLDSAFGDGGKLLIDVGGTSDWCHQMVLLADGRLLLAGSTFRGGNYDAALVRCMSSGMLDPTFGSGGKVVFPVSSGFDEITGLIVQPDGKIVVGGSAGSSMFAMRFNSDGTSDKGFGENGVMPAPLGFSNYGSSCIMQSDGKIVLGGSAMIDGISHALVCRLEGGVSAPWVGALASAVEITTSSARLTGLVNANEVSTTVWFETGESSNYGLDLPVILTPDDGTADQQASIVLSGLLPGRTYHYRLTAMSLGGTTRSADASFTTLSRHQEWRRHHFGTSESAGDAAHEADPDADGVSNLLEWAIGGDPTIPTRLQHSAEVEGDLIKFHYTRNVSALNEGVGYLVEWSDTLSAGSWSSAGVVQHILAQTGGVGVGSQLMVATLPKGGAGQRFVRLRVPPAP